MLGLVLLASICISTGMASTFLGETTVIDGKHYIVYDGSRILAETEHKITFNYPNGKEVEIFCSGPGRYGGNINFIEKVDNSQEAPDTNNPKPEPNQPADDDDDRSTRPPRPNTEPQRKPHTNNGNPPPRPNTTGRNNPPEDVTTAA